MKFYLKFLKENGGYTLTELLVVLALLTSVFIPIYSLYQSTVLVEFSAISYSQAQAYAQDALEAVYAISKDDWSQVHASLEEDSLDGDYLLALNPGGFYWDLEKVSNQPPSEDVLPLRRGFSRTVNIKSVWRDANGEIYTESGDGLLPDNSTKLVSVNVKWGDTFPKKELTINTYVANI